jgi:hypothetical protein
MLQEMMLSLGMLPIVCSNSAQMFLTQAFVFVVGNVLVRGASFQYCIGSNIRVRQLWELI